FLLAAPASAIDTLSLHDALPIFESGTDRVKAAAIIGLGRLGKKEAAQYLLEIPVPDSFKAPESGTEGPHATPNSDIVLPHLAVRSEEHTSELQSRENLVCRLLLE